MIVTVRSTPKDWDKGSVEWLTQMDTMELLFFLMW